MKNNIKIPKQKESGPPAIKGNMKNVQQNEKLTPIIKM